MRRRSWRCEAEEVPVEASLKEIAHCDAYRCLSCGAALRGDERALECECGRRYAVVAGVPMLLASQDHAAHADDEIVELNRLAGAKGWRDALEHIFGERPGRMRYVTAESRVQFLDLLPLTPASSVLEVGASLGQITEHIARRTRRVCALEVDPEQAKFAHTRCEQQGLHNVSVACGGHDHWLPYGDGLFDAVVLNLVLEWCGGYERSNSFRESQDLMLSECARVLKPGGHFFVATKNRFALTYLMGSADEHVDGMRFGNALPRSLMHLLLRLSGRLSPRGQLFSYDGLRRQLAAVGLSKPTGYWAVPDPRFPLEYVELEAKALREARPRLAAYPDVRRSTRLLALLPPWLLSRLTLGLVFVAQKPPSGAD